MRFDNIYQLIKSSTVQDSIDINNEVFEDDWQDDFIVGRDDEIVGIIDLIKNFVSGRKFYAIIEGPSGIGKSFILRSVIRALKSNSDTNVLDFFYTKSTERTPSEFINDVCKSLGIDGSFSMNRFENSIHTGMVIILDIISRHDIMRYLHRTILRFMPSKKVSFFIITSDGSIVHKFFKRNNIDATPIKHIKFRPYSVSEVVEILKHRAHAALIKKSENIIEDTIYLYIANKIVNDYKCNVRAGINVLKKIIISSCVDGKDIDIPSIDRAFDELLERSVQNVLDQYNWSDDHIAIFFKSVSNAVTPMKQADLYNVYREMCLNRNLSPHSRVWFGNMIRDLRHDELVDIVKKGGAGSLFNYVRLNVDAHIINEYVEKYV